jgi:hypothetical protein
MKKSATMMIIISLLAINIYADDDFYSRGNILFDRGYTKFSPGDLDTEILHECFEKILNKDHRFEMFSHIYRVFDHNDGFRYSLYFVTGEAELPNILVIVNLKRSDEKIFSYYKMNFNLEGVKIQTSVGDMLLFL